MTIMAFYVGVNPENDFAFGKYAQKKLKNLQTCRRLCTITLLGLLEGISIDSNSTGFSKYSRAYTRY